jgi:uncharacterized protein (TIGR02246 family)
MKLSETGHRGFEYARAMLRSIFLLMVAALCVCAATADDIQYVLRQQTNAWNRGDIAAFMTTYAPDTVFVSKEVTHGSAAVRERYEKTYSSREKMGKLTFSELEVRQVGPAAAYAIGHWALDRGAAAGGPVEGRFSLVFENRKGRWLIVLDHTH